MLSIKTEYEAPRLLKEGKRCREGKEGDGARGEEQRGREVREWEGNGLID